MKLSNEKIDDFQKLYKKHFNKEISREEALQKGIQLVRLVELIYKPMTKADFRKLQQRRCETGDINN